MRMQNVECRNAERREKRKCTFYVFLYSRTTLLQDDAGCGFDSSIQDGWETE